MEFYFPFTTTAMAILLAILLFLHCLWLMISKRNNSRKGKLLPPEPSGAWPIIGHLPLLAGPELPHVTLAKMADKYGPVFTIKQGVYRVLVVSSWEVAKECLTTNDKIFANRQKFLAAELLGYNYAMVGFSFYGPFWRHVRKITTIELLSNHRLHMQKQIRESEVKAAMKVAYESWEKNRNCSSGKVQIKMDQLIGDITMNVIYRIIVGKRYTNDGEENERWRETVKKFFELAGKFVVSDAVPYLRWLDIGGYEKAMKKTAKELDNVVEGWLNEHKQRRVNGVVKKDEEDFMDVMLSILHDGADDISAYDADTIIKATCLALILAGSDTTRVSMIWALCLLLNNPNTLKKAQQELDTQIGRERLVNESDLKNLVYLQAIIKETLRLHPPGPLSIPHESLKDCTVSGYHIRARTALWLNLWKIHRDPRVWLNPEEFEPERFFTTHKHVDVKGQDFELIPFSSGRRMCAGVSFALQVMQLTMASLLHGFDITTISGEPIEVSEGYGMIKIKDDSLQFLLTPRLPAHLYRLY